LVVLTWNLSGLPSKCLKEKYDFHSKNQMDVQGKDILKIVEEQPGHII
jgi:hypothetical protein